MTRRPAPDDRPDGNRDGADDPAEAVRAMLTGFWAVVLRRFADYLHRNGGLNRSGRSGTGESESR